MTTFDQVSTAAARLASARATLPPGAIELACHAAVPVAVDPTLLNLLRVNFFVDPPHDLPWSVEATLLTSPLFKELGGDLYEIDDDLRRQLLISLRTTYGPDRAVDVALLLERYCDRPGVWSAHPFLEQAQQLTAIGIIDPPAALHWLESAAADAGARSGLSKDWFVAMRGRLDRQPDPSLRLDTEIAEAINLLPSPSAVRRLAELGLLPGADLDTIRHALRSVRSDAAESALVLLDRPASQDPSSEDGGVVPLTDLLGELPIWDDPDGRLMPVPFGVDDSGAPVMLDLERHGPHGRIVAPEGAGRRELLRTIVLALAVTHPPHELELLLVDGSGARTFKDLDLPHTVGVITGRLTPISAGRLADDIGRELDRRMHLPPNRPNLLIVIDDYLDIPSRYAGLMRRFLDADDPRLHILLAVRLHDLRLRDPDDLLPHLAYEIRLGTGGTGRGTLQTLDADPQRFTAAGTFMAAAHSKHETIAVWLSGRMSAMTGPRPWIATPPPSAQPVLLDLLGPRQVVQGRGLTAGPQELWGKATGVAGIVASKDATGYEPLRIDLAAGNVAVVGRPHTGRVDVLIALVLSLALTNTPDEVQFVLLDRSGGLTPLSGLPHVRHAAGDDAEGRRDALRWAKEVVADWWDRPRIVLVLDRWDTTDPDAWRVEQLASLGPAHGVHVLISANSWDSDPILESFGTRIETKLAEPATSHIDPVRAAELYAEPLDCGLAPDGEHFVVALIGKQRTANRNHAAALAAEITAHWDDPSVPPGVELADCYFISHVRDDFMSVVRARELHRALGTLVRRHLRLDDAVPVGLAAYELPTDATAAADRTMSAVSVCQMFVTIPSDSYFEDKTCIREWNLFRSRPDAEPVVFQPRDSTPFGWEVMRLAATVLANVRDRRVGPAAHGRSLREIPDAFPLRSGRFALVIGTSTYADPALSDLPAARTDATDVAALLGDPFIGGFAVTTVLDGGTRGILEAIETFLSERTSTDLIVLYAAGHVLRNGRDRGVLAAGDTQVARPGASGINIQWLRGRLKLCRARRHVGILDVCAADDADGQFLDDQSAPRRGVTAAWVVGAYPRGHTHPTFTRALLSGLRDGAADGDGDGIVTVREAHRYTSTHSQGYLDVTPSMHVTEGGGDMILAAAVPVLRPR